MNGRKKPRISRFEVVDPMTALALLAPIEPEVRAQVNAQRHAALIRFAEGNATLLDLTVLDFATYIARALAQAGVGVELLALSDQAEQVIDNVRQRIKDSPTESTGPQAGEYAALQEVVELLDVQMQSINRGKYQMHQRSAIGALQRAGKFGIPKP